MTKQEHTKFVQAVRYSPSGSLFASAGFDGKVYIYDGTTSDLVGEVGSPAHQGGVYGVSELNISRSCQKISLLVKSVNCSLAAKLVSYVSLSNSDSVGGLETRWNATINRFGR